ncbi:MAG: nucleotidyltransferase family protein [Hyphomicrobiales bacterium]
MTGFRPQTAMVLAAGLGKRMRPITATVPKPLVEVAGKALIDHVLDRLVEAEVPRAVVNVHYLADLVEVRVGRRSYPHIEISDERAALLETGGGIVKALPMLGSEPFLVLNTDSIWIEGPRANLLRLADGFDPERMDGLLMLAATVASVGYDGAGDFSLDGDGRVARRTERRVAPFVYTGAAILHPRLFEGAPDGAFSLNSLFDKAIEAERLYGMRLDGIWMHVGTPQAIGLAETCLAESAA